MMTLYGYPRSRSLRALWALEEAGADYRYIRVNLGAGEGRREPFLSLNPGGKVPVLVDGDLVLTESMAICTYIGDQVPDKLLIPGCGSRERALYYKWCSFIVTELEQPLWTIARHRFILPRDLRVPAVKETARHEFAVAVAVLGKMFPGGEFLLGERFCMADILLVQTLDWALTAGLACEDPLLLDYVENLKRRPALARALSQDEPGPQ